MKKLWLKLIPFLAIPLLFSCEEVREEITISADGSGNYEVYTDMLPMMRAMAAMGVQGEMSDEEKQAKIEEQIWKGKPGKIDSVIDFSEKIEAEYKKKEYQDLDKKTRAYFKGGREEGKMVMGVTFQFKDGKELDAFQQMLESSQKNKDNSSKGMGKTKSTTKLSSTSFSRTTKIIEKVDLNDANIKMTLPFVAPTKMVAVVKTHKKIKSVKINFVKEQKEYEVVFECSLASLLKQEINNDFTIEF